MDTIFIISQTVFYFTVSIAIIVVGIIFSLIMYHVMKIVREIEVMVKNLHNVTDEALERIDEMIERLSALPLLSLFLKKKRRHVERVKRNSVEG